MKDGVKLAFILRKPSNEGRFPVLVTYDAYWGGATRLGPEESEYLRHGYAILGLSVRGTGASEGTFTSPFAAHEGEDGKAAIEWVGQQPWCDGNVGMYGNSYAGVTQLEVAAKRPKYLKALAAGGIWGDSYADVSYPGGIFNFGLVGQWSYETLPYFSVSSARVRQFAGDGEAAERRQANPPSGESFHEMRAHPLKDAWWAVLAFEDVAPQIAAPTLIFQGWHDAEVGASGALRVFERLQAPKRILLSNGGGSTFAVPSLLALRVRWFDRWLKGKDNGVDKEPPITVWFETREEKRQPRGSPNKGSGALATPPTMTLQLAAFSPTNAKPAWTSTFSAWPIPEVQWSPLYLTADGKLTPEQRALEKASGERSYLYPAGTEIVSTNEAFATPPASVGCLLYRTGAMPEDLAVIGSPVLTLYASTEQKDTDVMAVLHDVSPKGEITFLQRGLLRASHRALDPKKCAPHAPVHSHIKAEELTPGCVYEIKFQVLPFGHVLRRGHSLELAIMAPPANPSPSWAFMPVAPPSLNTIHHSIKYPSNLELPVLPGAKAQAPDPPFGSLPLQPAREEPPRGRDSPRRALEEILRSWKREKAAPG